MRNIFAGVCVSLPITSFRPGKLKTATKEMLRRCNDCNGSASAGFSFDGSCTYTTWHITSLPLFLSPFWSVFGIPTKGMGKERNQDSWHNQGQWSWSWLHRKGAVRRGVYFLYRLGVFQESSPRISSLFAFKFVGKFRPFRYLKNSLLIDTNTARRRRQETRARDFRHHTKLPSDCTFPAELNFVGTVFLFHSGWQFRLSVPVRAFFLRQHCRNYKSPHFG